MAGVDEPKPHAEHSNRAGSRVTRPFSIFNAILGCKSDAEDFSEGLAEITVGRKVGYIDINGNIVITPRFDDAQNFSDGVAPAELNDKWGYIDKSRERGD